MEIREDSVYDYSAPVYKVLMTPNLILGIGITPVMVILVLTIILMNTVSIWCVVIGVVLLLIARFICRNDHYMLNFVFDRILQPRVWRAA